MDNLITFKEIIKLSESMSSILAPFCQIDIYDLNTKNPKLIKTFNSFTDNKVGDFSEDFDKNSLERASLNNYTLINNKVLPNGKIVKLMIIGIKNFEDELFSAISISFDVTLFSTLNTFLSNFFNKGNLKQSNYSESNTQIITIDKIKNTIDNYCFKKNKNIFHLSKEDKEYIVKELKNKGFFDLKNSITITSKILSVSRATIYNYINSKDVLD